MDTLDLITIELAALLNGQLTPTPTIERILNARRLVAAIQYSDREAREQIEPEPGGGQRRENLVIKNGTINVLETIYSILPTGDVNWTIPSNRRGEIISVILEAESYLLSGAANTVFRLAINDTPIITDIKLLTAKTFDLRNSPLNPGDQFSVSARAIVGLVNPIVASMTIIGRELAL